MCGKYFIGRFLISNAIGKAILVSISYPINFYGQYTVNHIAEIAVNTWIYKMMIAIILLPIAVLLAHIIKKIEKIDYFDYGISYNPIAVFNDNVSGKNNYEREHFEKWHRENDSNK